MGKRTKDWQDKLLRKYKAPSTEPKEKKSILNKKQLKRVLKTDAD